MKEKKDLILIKKRISIILKFLKDNNYGGPFIDEFVKIAEEQKSKNNMPGLKNVFSELINWAKDAPKDKYSILTKELNSLDNKLFDEELQNQLNEIIEKKIIENEEEYRIVLDRVEEIHDDDESSNEVEVLNELLVNFHKKL